MVRRYSERCEWEERCRGFRPCLDFRLEAALCSSAPPEVHVDRTSRKESVYFAPGLEVPMTSQLIGTVVCLWRYPVKSMMGEELNATEVTKFGLLGDRAYAVFDVETG